MIPKLTLSGIDEHTSVGWLKKAASKYCDRSGASAIEFGILLSQKRGGISSRYPSRQTINKITGAIYPHNLAFHLCGRYADMVHERDWLELANIIDFDLVGRVQVNSTLCDEAAIYRLQQFSIFIDKPVIMQWRERMFPCAVGLHLLQDNSGGRGIPETKWGIPDELCRKSSTTKIGYAGGLSPNNILQALPYIRASARCGGSGKGKPFWIDCESGIRDELDRFDEVKATAMADAVFFGTEPTSQTVAA